MKSISTASLAMLGISLTALSATTCHAQASQMAQQPEPQTADDPTERATAEPVQGSTDIVVTATRRAERLRDVPVAVTAFDTRALRSESIRDMTGLRFATPALQVTPSSFGASVPGYTIRAQRLQESIITQDPSVVVYFAEVAQERPHGTSQALYDLGSVEVLKGPQGTLFGRSTTGGAILINPAKPTFDLGGSAAVTVGNYGLVSTTAILNVPLSDTLAVRAAGQINRRDGYYRNSFNGQETDGERTENARLSLLWQPSDAFSSYTVGSYYHENSPGSSFRLQYIRPGSSADTPAMRASLATQQANGLRYVDNNAQPYARVRTYQISNTTAYEAGHVTFKNIIGFRKVKSDIALDYDGTRQVFFETKNFLDASQFSEEFQVSGKLPDGRLDYIGGLYFFRETGRDIQNSVLGGTRVNDGEARNTSYSAFGQVSYRLTDLVKLTAGLRYTVDERQNGSRNLLNGACRIRNADGTTPNPCYKLYDTTFRSPSWLVSLDYKPSDSTLLYISHRRGYRSGGWNLRANLPGEQVPFRPEIVYDIEAGIKTSLLDGRLRFNAAAYYQWYNDIQRSLQFGSPVQTVIVNAAKARIPGAELEVTALPVDFLELKGSFGYTRPRYRQFTYANLGDLSFNRFSQAPERTVNLSARLIAPLPPEQGTASVRFGFYHQSRIQLADLNGFFEPGYSLYEVSANWDRIGGSRFDLAAFGKNLGNAAYVTSGVVVYSTSGTQSVQIGQPRTFGLELRFHFGSGV